VLNLYRLRLYIKFKNRNPPFIPFHCFSIIVSHKMIQEECMSEFKNVTIIKAANVYFDGQVTSRTVVFEDGTKKTLGIMNPGEYEFGTEAAEIMEIMAGDLDVLLPGSDEWKAIKGGESFNVPANSKFGIKIKTLTDYCCSYITE